MTNDMIGVVAGISIESLTYGEAVYRLTRGRHTFVSLLSGLPVVMLTTTGARTGRERTAPVLGLPTADGLGVIASNFGQRHHPSWYYNLRAHPDGYLAVNGRTRRFRAIEVEDDRRGRIWAEGASRR